MGIRRINRALAEDASNIRVSSPVEELLLAALERGNHSFETGRYLVTAKKEATTENVMEFLGQEGPDLRVADARDYENQAAILESAGDANAFTFPEIGVMLVDSNTIEERSGTMEAIESADSPIESIDPEYFVFSQGIDPVAYMEGLADVGTENIGEFLRGFARAAEVIAAELKGMGQPQSPAGQEDALALGATWGLAACRVPGSSRSGNGIKVAVLDTGMDLGHGDFTGRFVTSETFVGQPVQDLHSHGTHCIGTSCGTRTPAGTTPRYGIAHQARIFAGKVLTNSGSGVTGSVSAGINWAIANRCEVISMSLGSPAGVQPAYTAAGTSALNKGLLIVAAAGNEASPTGSPANSPSIMSVASLDSNLRPSSFSNFGKVEIAGPGRDVFSSVPRPTRYGTKSGTSMATPHVAGCAALWAETSASLRGMLLWRKLLATARALPQPASRVGAGLVQAP